MFCFVVMTKKKANKVVKILGRPKAIETPETLYKLFEQYKKNVKSKPFKVKDWVGGYASEVKREKEKPLTMEGFECSVPYPKTLDQYFANKEDRYLNFVAICSRIRKEIRDDQISGGMAGLYNPSITQRLNNLVDKSETIISEQPLLPD